MSTLLERGRVCLARIHTQTGNAFIEQFIDESDSWSNKIKQLKMRKGSMCFLPDDADEIDLKDF